MLAVSRRLTIAAALTSFGVAGRWLGVAGAAVPVAPDTNLLADPDAPVLGNPAGRLAMAEFYDYRCPPCRQMHAVVSQLLQEDHNIRFIAKNWPILGPVSALAARVALAANWQGHFAAVHDALFRVTGRLNEAKIREAAATAGIDLARLDRDMNQRADELDAMLGDVKLDAASLGLQGPPGFVIGPYLVPGALSYEDLRGLIERARTRGG